MADLDKEGLAMPHPTPEQVEEIAVSLCEIAKSLRNGVNSFLDAHAFKIENHAVELKRIANSLRQLGLVPVEHLGTTSGGQGKEE